MKKIRVFHGLVNYGTQAGLLARGFRNIGIDALSVSYPDRYKRIIDVELLHGGCKPIKIIKHTWNWIRRFFWFFRFNIFHFYYGTTLLPGQFDLPFYRFFNKHIIMHYLGSDIQLTKDSLNKYKWTNMLVFSDNPIKQNLRDDTILKRFNYESKYVNLKIVCSPGLVEFVDNSLFLPLAIDTKQYSYSPKTKKPSRHDYVKILHTPTSRGYKGTSYITNSINILKNEGYLIDLLIVENCEHHELIKLYKECDIFIDQVLAGWYGTAAIEAMSIGRPVIAYIREDYLEYVPFRDDIPVINANPDNLTDILRNILNNTDSLTDIGKSSSNYVADYHDSNKIVEQLKHIYNTIHY